MTREEAIQELEETNTILKSWGGFTEYPQALYIAIEMAIEALKDRPHGEWIARTIAVGGKEYIEYSRCSECGEIAFVHMNFCPNCGADMRGEEE